MWLTRLAINRPIIIWMALVAIAVLGMVSYSRLPAELNPRVDIPTLVVTTIYPGAGPEEIEGQVTKPLEDAVGSMNNVKDVFSSSQESVSIISMDFSVGTDVDKAAASLREKVEAVRTNLPAGARAPIVAKLDINAQPVLYLGLASATPSRTLREMVDTKIVPRLSRVPGVAGISVAGGEQREVQVRVNGARLEQYGLTVQDVANAIKANSQNVPGGSIVQGRRDIGVRTIAAFGDLDEIRNAQILSQQLMMPTMAMPGAPAPGPSAPLTVGDVATVVDTAAPTQTITRVNGRDSIALIVNKVADANTVAVADGVKAELERQKAALPPDTTIAVSRDDSVVVRDALEDVNATLVLGALLAMTVVYLFLHNFRGTLIVSIALPACLVATFLVMYFSGFTLNQMTLLALSLSVGILIDDSIVVLESITRHLGYGEPPEEAAFNGRTEIGFADITTTLVDVVVFLPIAFMGGIVGAFFKQFGLTIVAATLFSLIVSFTVTPSLASRWYRKGEDLEKRARGLAWLEAGLTRLDHLYRRVIERALANRWWVVAFAAASLITAVLFASPSLGFEFLPATDQGQIAVTVECPPDSSLAATDTLARQIEQRLSGAPDVVNYVTTVGEILGGFGSIPRQGPQYAQINVRLTDKQGVLERLFGTGGAVMRKRTDQEVAADLRRRLQGLPGGRVAVATVRSSADIGPAVQIQLKGANLDDLASAAAQITDRLSQMPGIIDPDVSLRNGKPELQVRVDRARAAAQNVAPSQAGAIVRDSLEGNTDSAFREGNQDLPIRVQLAGIDRNEPNDVRQIPVGYNNGRVVTAGDVATIRMGVGPSAIERTNGQRMVTITANLAAGYPLGNAQSDITARMADIPMQGIELHWGGETETMNENAYYFAAALGLAVMLVYLVMASLFNNLLNPLIIMFTLPMALVGALIALVITGETLSLVAMIGIIMLTGLMGRNAILLIDYTGTLRARGMARNEAVAQAGATRLRPILMTTFATIFGMLPVAMRIGRASEQRAPMAIVVIGGLVVSTVLTLVVIPVVYTLFDDLVDRRKARRQTGTTAQLDSQD